MGFVVPGFYYMVIPYSGNYQIVTKPYLTVIQNQGEYYAHYNPDHPKQGDEIHLYFDLCDVSNNCEPCTNYTINAYTYDENNQKRYLLEDHEHSGNNPILLTYNGKRIYIEIKIGNFTYNFFVPVLSNIESFLIALEKSTIFTIGTLIITFFPIIGLLKYRKNIPSFIKKAKKKLVKEVNKLSDEK